MTLVSPHQLPELTCGTLDHCLNQDPTTLKQYGFIIKTKLKHAQNSTYNLFFYSFSCNWKFLILGCNYNKDADPHAGTFSHYATRYWWLFSWLNSQRFQHVLMWRIGITFPMGIVKLHYWIPDVGPSVESAAFLTY